MTELWHDGPRDATHTFVLAHGAGAPADHPAMQAITERLANRGLHVVRFEFPYMARRRSEGKKGGPDRMPVLEATWREVIDQLGGGGEVVIGGRSMGGRVASRIADDVGARGLVCLGYPFHPPGKPEKTRTEHLADLRTPSLIVQGTRDPFGKPDEIASYVLSDPIRVLFIEDGDHGLVPRKKSGRTPEQNLDEAAAAIAAFIEELDPAEV
ncbi:MAG: alpha/beta fold hydrolase [Acidobacteriota bacterium]